MWFLTNSYKNQFCARYKTAKLGYKMLNLGKQERGMCCHLSVKVKVHARRISTDYGDNVVCRTWTQFGRWWCSTHTRQSFTYQSCLALFSHTYNKLFIEHAFHAVVMYETNNNKFSLVKFDLKQIITIAKLFKNNW